MVRESSDGKCCVWGRWAKAGDRGGSVKWQNAKGWKAGGTGRRVCLSLTFQSVAAMLGLFYRPRGKRGCTVPGEKRRKEIHRLSWSRPCIALAWTALLLPGKDSSQRRERKGCHVGYLCRNCPSRNKRLALFSSASFRRCIQTVKSNALVQRFPTWTSWISGRVTPRSPRVAAAHGGESLWTVCREGALRHVAVLPCRELNRRGCRLVLHWK